jgi:threonyl-tRNA synthetase
MGDLKVWNDAEDTLRQVLDEKMPGKWHVNEEDAAFYGPKLDFQLVDALKRPWQCGTIQLDFNLPERFNLRYRAPAGPKEKGEVKEVKDKEVKEVKEVKVEKVEEGKEDKKEGKKDDKKVVDPLENGDFKRPVMIHRAILGSLERFMAIITESTGGKWYVYLLRRLCSIGTSTPPQLMRSVH